MNPTSFPATELRSNQRIKLAIQALSGTANISHLAAEHHVSRKNIYQKKEKPLPCWTMLLPPRPQMALLNKSEIGYHPAELA